MFRVRPKLVNKSIDQIYVELVQGETANATRIREPDPVALRWPYVETPVFPTIRSSFATRQRITGTLNNMPAADHFNDNHEFPDSSVPSGYRKVDTADGPKIVREGPVSFVRRELSMSPNRQRLWQDHLGTTVLPVTRSFADTSVAPRSELDVATVWGQDAPLIVDIGVGHGESTFAGAQAHPDRNFLAVEVYRPGLAKLLDRLETDNVTNVRMVEANAPEVLDHMLGEGTVSEVWVFFSDPWPKNRYHKRRLIQPKFLDRVARVLADNGVLRLATDWSHYAAQMRDTLDDHPRFENLYPTRLAGETSPLTLARSQGTDDGNALPLHQALDTRGGWAPRFATRPVTSFEAKAQRAGRYIFDLTYQKV